jgi:hypothetical protein
MPTLYHRVSQNTVCGDVQDVINQGATLMSEGDCDMVCSETIHIFAVDRAEYNTILGRAPLSIAGHSKLEIALAYNSSSSAVSEKKDFILFT